MSVKHVAFQGKNRRPPLGQQESPSNVYDRRLLKSLFDHSEAVASMEPTSILLKKTSASVIRKAMLISVVVEELVRDPPVNVFSTCAILCFEELCVVLQRIRALIEDCASGSRMWRLIQIPLILDSFHQLVGELAMVLDILPVDEVNLNQDLGEMVNLIRKHCSEKPVNGWDSDDVNLRNEVVRMLENIKRKIVPDQSTLSEIFTRLKLTDSASCSNEIQNLENEVRSQDDESKAEEAIALIGLVRYSKCVLYGASTPRIAPRRQKSASEFNIPADFRCPVTLDLMTDPVTVSTGQTYDRSSIAMWIDSGHATCPKTGQPLAHKHLIPNLALKNLIALWCRDHGIPLDSSESNVKHNGGHSNKVSLEATKMTASFLVSQLTAASQSPEATDRLVYELRVLSKTDSDSRACIAEAGALFLLVKCLSSEHPSLQINAVTTILNLSILEANKTRIMETDGVLNGVIEVLRSGLTWEAKGNAAATIFSLSWPHAYRKKLGKTRIIRSLVDLAKMGPTSAKRDALTAISNLAGNKETVAKLMDAGIIDLINDLIETLAEEAVSILEAVVKRGGLPAISAVHECKIVEKLIMVMRNGTDKARERAAATLVDICRKGGSEMAAQMAEVAGVERVIWEVMGMGSGRARRKAASLLRILRTFTAEMAVDSLNASFHESATLSNVLATTRIVMPA